MRDELAPVSTPAVYGPCCVILKAATWLRAVLAGANQRLWLLTLDDVYDSSFLLGMSSSLALRPPWRWQPRKLPHGCLLTGTVEVHCLGSSQPDRCQSRWCR